jgi:hypothetical protein
MQGISSGGRGDMQKGTYDADADSAVDLAAGGTGAKTAAAARTAMGVGSSGRTLFVDSANGSNATGTRGRADLPYLTIAAACAASLRGDTVYIRPGRYNERVLGKSFSAAVTAAARASNVVTITAATHGFVAGDRVRVVGTASVDGEHVVLSAVAGSFTVYLAGADDAAIVCTDAVAIGVLNLFFEPGATVAFSTAEVEGAIFDDSTDCGLDGVFWLVIGGHGSFTGINTTLGETAGGILFCLLTKKGSCIDATIQDFRSATTKMALFIGDSQKFRLISSGDLWAGYDLVSGNTATNLDCYIRAGNVRANGAVVETGHSGRIFVEFAHAVATNLVSDIGGGGTTVVKGKTAALGTLFDAAAGAGTSIIECASVTCSSVGAGMSVSATGTQSIQVVNTNLVCSNANAKICDVLAGPTLFLMNSAFKAGGSATNSFTGTGGAVNLKTLNCVTNKALHANVTAVVGAMAVSADL